MRSIFGKLPENKWFAVILAALALAFSASNAEAHAKLLRSSPGDGETLRQSPRTVEFTFSEELQNVSANTIVVTDQNGSRVDKNAVVISEDGKKMSIELQELSDGSFTVEWKALSADDHTMKGKFSFKIALAAAVNQANTAAAPSPVAARTPMTHEMPMQESGVNFAQSVVRWLAYLAMMTLFGGFAFRLFVLKPSLSQAADLNDKQRIAGLRTGENRFIKLAWLSLALLTVSALASLILQTSAVSDVSLARAFAPSRVFQVLTETSYGAPWILQMSVIIALAVVVFFIARGRKDLRAKPAFLWVGLILCASLFLAPSLTGHARAAVKEYQFAIISDWLHLVAVGIWVGGLFQMALTMPKAVAHLDGKRRLRVLARAIPLFSRLAVAATILITLTGIYNSWIHVDGFSALWNTTYGQVLMIKVILFLPMLAIGGLNTFILRPREKRLLAEAISADEHLRADRIFYRSVRIEAAFGIIVLLLAAILAFLPPARRHEMMMSVAANFQNRSEIEIKNLGEQK